jgi:hypothetical protein
MKTGPKEKKWTSLKDLNFENVSYFFARFFFALLFFCLVFFCFAKKNPGKKMDPGKKRSKKSHYKKQFSIA